jgi:hypothetical protein
MGLFDWFSKNRPLRNDALDQLMGALARNDTREGRQALYRELLKSRLILPTPGMSARPTPLPPGSAIRFVSTTGPQGGSAMLVFSSDEALRAWRPAGCDHIIAPARELFGMALRSGLDSVMVNPRGPAGGVIDRLALAALAEGRVPPGEAAEVFRVGAGQKMVLGLPKTPPKDALLAALRAQCARVQEVRAAWLLQVSIEGGEPHLLLALELDDGAPEQGVMDRVMEGVKPALGAGDTSTSCRWRPGASSRRTSGRSRRPSSVAKPFRAPARS